jgi:3,4-dihydroxy 2-butanone 4-phosphate synthase/GTP cyclohydrolase II
MVREEAIETEFGPFRLQMFQDQILGGTHLCLIKGQPSPDRPCLVRVHVPDTLRDLVQVSWQGRGSWPLPQALKMVADAGEGVVVILENRGDEPIEERLAQYVGDTLPKPGTRLVPYLTVGTGSQILKHANVGKMRLLSTPMKFSAISGFDLEVVEYVEYEG